MGKIRLLGLSLNLFSLVRTALLLVVLITAAVIFIGVPLPISGSSMVPNFESGEIVLIEKISYFGDQEIKRGDVVATRFPADPKKTRLIKRVIGLPGEFIEYRDNKFFINFLELEEKYQIIEESSPYQGNKSVQLGQGEYFLAGDNRPGSSDSRFWGPVQRQDIQGRASFVLLPVANWRYIDRIN